MSALTQLSLTPSLRITSITVTTHILWKEILPSTPENIYPMAAYCFPVKIVLLNGTGFMSLTVAQHMTVAVLTVVSVPIVLTALPVWHLTQNVSEVGTKLPA